MENLSFGAHFTPPAKVVSWTSFAWSLLPRMSLVAWTEMLEKSKVGVTRKVYAVSLKRWYRAVAPNENLPTWNAPETPSVRSCTFSALRNGRMVNSKQDVGFWFCIFRQVSSSVTLFVPG